MFIYGDNITPINLYRIIGRENYHLTIFLKDTSKLREVFPSIISGSLFYTQDERKSFENNIDILKESSIIKIASSMHKLSAEQIKKLKYKGISCSEIDVVGFIPLSSDTKEDDKGIKKIPNIIEIPYKQKYKYEYEGIILHLYSRLLLRDEPLLDEELYEFIGIMLAMNDSSIPAKYLEKIKLTISGIENNPKIGYYYLLTKSKKTELDENEKQRLKDLDAEFFLEKLFVLSSELKKASSNLSDLSKYSDQFDKIMEEIKRFKTHRFGFRKPVIYWDIESYLHIILRHLNETQVGEHFIDRSTIPYKFDDLKILLGKILDTLDKEIQDHFIKNPNQKFTRHGKMSVFFNNDYYTIDIEPDGRISTFYKNKV